MRRTSSLDVDWPDGRTGDLRVVARARDIYTAERGGTPIVIAEDSYEARMRADRHVVSLDATPPRPQLSKLAGMQAGGGFRKTIGTLLEHECAAATPLSLILDDIPGTSVVFGWAWSQWGQRWLPSSHAAMTQEEFANSFQSRLNVCAGYTPGSSAFELATDRAGTPTLEVKNPDDPQGWHALIEQDGRVAMRRARRIDVSRYQDEIRVESAFQDSATLPEGGRSVVHEYSVYAVIDAVAMRLKSIEAIPHVVPYRECPSAVIAVQRLVGCPVSELRKSVSVEMRGGSGCTHLNDAVRAIADVPSLVRHLDERSTASRP